MASLSFKSSDELCKLLDEYGINHGPIVDSTRKLYEKKLSDAMAKKQTGLLTRRTTEKKRRKSHWLDITHHVISTMLSIAGATGNSGDVPVVSYTQTAYQSAPRARSTAYTSKSILQDASPGTVKSDGSKSGGIPGWLRVLVFIIIAVFLYYVYSNMESAEENPFKKIDA